MEAHELEAPPPRADLDFRMVSDIQRLARTSCVDFAQTVSFLAMLEVRRIEFQTETGFALERDILARIPSSAMDEDTVGRLEDAGISAKN